MTKIQWLGRAVFALCALGTSIAYAEDKQPRIVGGSDVSIDNAPWQVYVQGTNGASSLACGGTIIADNYILTAAHCFMIMIHIHTPYMRAARIGLRAHRMRSLRDLFMKIMMMTRW
nr:trypsin-like serine protease [Enterovibrio nigricans]